MIFKQQPYKDRLLSMRRQNIHSMLPKTQMQKDFNNPLCTI